MIFSHRYITILMMIVLIFSACGINPVTRKRELNFISEEREISLGRNASYSITQQYGVYNNTALENYVNKVGQQLVSVSDRTSIPYEFHVVDMPILNAFALPGGYIYITRGLLAELDNEAQLASVLGSRNRARLCPPQRQPAFGTIGISVIDLSISCCSRHPGDGSGSRSAYAIDYLRL